MWFTENAWPPMFIAGLCALVFFGMWSADRRNLYFFLGVGSLGMIGGAFVLERLILTDGERLQLNVSQLCDEFRRRDPLTLNHFSDTAPDLKEMVQVAMKQVEVGNDLNLTDFRTKITNENSRAEVHFRANATISTMGFTGHHPFRCVLTFQKEGGLWKIVEIQRLDPIKGDKIETMAHR